MESKPWEQKEVPWCTVCLVTMIVGCHLAVLMGNMSTAGAMSAIGTSTGGWSGVGLDLSHALQDELDEVMKNVTEKITESINQTLQMQSMIDMMLGLMGQTVDNVTESNVTKALFLLQGHNIHHAIQHGKLDDAPVGGVTGMIMGSVDQLITQLMAKVTEGLDKLLEVIKPALEKVGEFIIQFGDKVQAMLESFSVTLDKVQKIFDQVMSSMSSSGGAQEHMVYDSYATFDITSTGSVSLEDMKLVAETYKISALQGDKADDLLKKYDEDGSGGLSQDEYEKMVEDPGVPDVMPVVLRSFANRLAEVAGQLGGSKFRDEIAQNVVAYLYLMGAKNMTKVHWVSDTLTNGSLPLPFTGDVMVNLALAEDDPNMLTTARDIGQTVISTFLELHPEYTVKAFNQLSDPKYWHDEGYDPDDQPTVVERVTKWIAKGSSSGANALLQTLAGEQAVAGEHPQVVMLEQEVLEAMPAIAKRNAAKSMKEHVTKLKAERDAHYNQLYASKTSQKLLVHLLGGVHASDTSSTSSPATRAISSGVPAKPETLKFAKFLSWNASATAARFNGYCFNYSSTSSNAIDGFATVIQGMVRKIQSFIKQMEKYATPAGIENLENKVKSFADKGLQDVTKIIKTKVDDVMTEFGPELDDAIHSAVHSAGESMGKMLGDVLGTSIGQSMRPLLGSILGKMVGNESEAGAQLGDQLGDIVGDQTGAIAGNVIGDKIGDLLEDMLDKALSSASDALSSMSDSSLLGMPANAIGPLHLHLAKYNKSHASPEEIADFESKLYKAMHKAERTVKVVSRARKDTSKEALLRSLQELEEEEPEKLNVRKSASNCDFGSCLSAQGRMSDIDAELALEDPDAMSGVWTSLTGLLKSLTNLLPLATENLKFARKEVGKLAKNLDNIFTMFSDSGSPIFDKIGSMWRIVWILYFCFMAPLTCCMLFYGFWAGGYFGGPGAPPTHEEEDPEKYKGICGKLHACCDTCCSCLRNCHDTHLCFWSILVLLQIFCLILFIVSLVFCLFAGIKMFVASGCASIYILGDGAICGSTLLSLRDFLATFMGTSTDEAFSHICDENQLLTCNMIGSKMKMSGILTASGSFMAAILSFQLLIESSILHTRAVERRRLAILDDEKK